MKKKQIIVILIFILFGIMFATNSYAGDLDRITNYEITVDPRMNDGTLDITYKITWKVLDSTSEGPLEWVKIGTSNSNFNNPIALTNNIKSIVKYDGAFVRIDFKRAYNAGEKVTFKYSIHQGSMHKKFFNNCNFTFTPAWFTGAEIDSMTIKWNKDQVEKSDANSTIDNYLIWEKTNMKKGEKLTASVKYKKSSFAKLSAAELIDTTSTSYESSLGTEVIGSKVFESNFSTYGTSNYSNNLDSNNMITLVVFITIIIMIIFVVITIISVCIGGDSYYRHGGFYGGYHGSRYYGGCVRSSCACASSCASSCACACAGSGRAGCSKKDFYGTKINMNKLREKILNKK